MEAFAYNSYNDCLIIHAPTRSSPCIYKIMLFTSANYCIKTNELQWLLWMTAGGKDQTI